MINKDDILNFLKEKKQILFIDYQIVKIGLFGSFANNEATEESDIDLLIEFHPDTQNLLEKKLKIKELINNQFHRKVDLCREKYIKPYFKKQILNTVIYV